MKKNIALYITLCMFLVATLLSVSDVKAASNGLENEPKGEILAYFEAVPDGKGGADVTWYDAGNPNFVIETTSTETIFDGSMVQPQNQNWGNMLSASTAVSTFFTNGTYNLKVHMNLSSNSVGVGVHFEEGSAATANSRLITTWYGTGHKYADLKRNAPPNRYSVCLTGHFFGSGYVYSEP